MIKCGLLLQDTLHEKQRVERTITTRINARFSNQYLILFIDWTVSAVISRVVEFLLLIDFDEWLRTSIVGRFFLNKQFVYGEKLLIYKYV